MPKTDQDCIVAKVQGFKYSRKGRAAHGLIKLIREKKVSDSCQGVAKAVICGLKPVSCWRIATCQKSFKTDGIEFCSIEKNSVQNLKMCISVSFKVRTASVL
ncbi:MAG: hypothetical protein EOP14_04985 [Pseudomonas sp.]|nr:MAG: hypothetical protein EOP14_04985 [Pseudomonas sp.]